MKILFLDIDGVLNSRRTSAVFGGFPQSLKHLDRFDPVALGLVRNLCDAGVDVVLSSSWREDYAHDQVGGELGLKVIDCTPSIPGPRGGEIAAWLNAHDAVETWAIVDDSPEMLAEQLDRFVQTDPENGLLWRDYVRLCEILELGTVLRA